jgi:orotate phosphoribosyltransferase
MLTAGLIQFGRFAGVNGFDPLRLHLELLPSYPHLLGEIAQVISVMSDAAQYDFIVAAPDAQALGTAVSLRCGLPLVYSCGRGEPPTHDLVGAYDVGHPALLVSLIHDGHAQIERIVRDASSVGLDLTAAAAIIDYHDRAGQNNRPRTSVWTLRGLIESLENTDDLPAEQAAAIREWLTRRRPD